MPRIDGPAPHIQPQENPQIAGLNPDQPQAADRVRQAEGAQPQRINEVVRQAEVLPPPAPRAAQAAAPQRSLAARIGIVALRVLLGIGSLGLSEGVYALIRRAEQQSAAAPRAPELAAPAAAPRLLSSTVPLPTP